MALVHSVRRVKGGEANSAQDLHSPLRSPSRSAHTFAPTYPHIPVTGQSTAQPPMPLASNLMSGGQVVATPGTYGGGFTSLDGVASTGSTVSAQLDFYNGALSWRVIRENGHPVAQARPCCGGGRKSAVQSSIEALPPAPGAQVHQRRQRLLQRPCRYPRDLLPRIPRHQRWVLLSPVCFSSTQCLSHVSFLLVTERTSVLLQAGPSSRPRRT